MYNAWFSHMNNRMFQNDIFFSEGSNGAGKKEFVSQFDCWQSHFYIKCKWWINDK